MLKSNRDEKEWRRRRCINALLKKTKLFTLRKGRDHSGHATDLYTKKGIALLLLFFLWTVKFFFFFNSTIHYQQNPLSCCEGHQKKNTKRIATCGQKKMRTCFSSVGGGRICQEFSFFLLSPMMICLLNFFFLGADRSELIGQSDETGTDDFFFLVHSPILLLLPPFSFPRRNLDVLLDTVWTKKKGVSRAR